MLNGKRVCTAGIYESGVLSFFCTYTLRDPESFNSDPDVEIYKEEWAKLEFDFSVSGIDHALGENVHVDWLRQDLRVGDVLKIRILPPGEFDEHKSQYIFDPDMPTNDENDEGTGTSNSSPRA